MTMRPSRGTRPTLPAVRTAAAARTICGAPAATACSTASPRSKRRLERADGAEDVFRVANASVAELSPFVGRKTAEEIVEHFSRQRALAGGEQETITEGAGDSTIAGSAQVIEPEQIETRLDDPEGEAEDLQPIRSVDHAGQVRAPRRSTRKRGERSSNPHGIKREKLSTPEIDAEKHSNKEEEN